VTTEKPVAATWSWCQTEQAEDGSSAKALVELVDFCDGVLSLAMTFWPMQNFRLTMELRMNKSRTI